MKTSNDNVVAAPDAQWASEGAKENGHDAELKRRLQRRVDKLDEIADLQEELKGFKAEDKADGFDEKAMSATVRDMRRTSAALVDQITLEQVRATYRRAAGLPTTIEAAQKAARDEADRIPGNAD